uniref:Ion transport domain-containing protein n=1 Tax=Nomascus leucogenys TaxID=61853 RepID=A0A2I3FY99_NOMLE
MNIPSFHFFPPTLHRCTLLTFFFFPFLFFFFSLPPFLPTFLPDLPNSLVTVFILFTLDHWYALLQDVWKVPEVSLIFSSIYFILWLLLGSIIFRSIIVAMMVTDFQNIRKELNEEMARREFQLKADMFKRQIIQRNMSREALRSSHSKIDDRLGVRASQQRESLDLSEVSEVESNYGATEEDLITSASKTEETLSKKREYQSSSCVSSTSSSYSSSSESRFSESIGCLDWETLVHENLPGLIEMDQDDRVSPRDSLFQYFELLEKLQYNLEEHKKLQEFAGNGVRAVMGTMGIYIYIYSVYSCPLFWHLSFSISAYN